MNDALYSSARDDWGTPQPLFDMLHERHQFDVDVAANRSNHKLPRWLGPDHPEEGFRDAFAVSWGRNRCWLNPQYGDKIARWLERAADAALCGALVVALPPARTDTRWWHETVMLRACRVEFIRGRLTFEMPEDGRECSNCAHNAARKKGRQYCMDFWDLGGWKTVRCLGWRACPAPFPSAVVTFSPDIGGPPRFDVLEVPK